MMGKAGVFLKTIYTISAVLGAASNAKPDAGITLFTIFVQWLYLVCD